MSSVVDSHLLIVNKRPLAYAATTDSRAVRHLLTLKHNGTRTVLLFLQSLSLLSHECEASASSLSSPSLELRWSVLANMTSDQLLAQRTRVLSNPPSGYFTDVVKGLDDAQKRAFDQYSGLRAYGDLRGLPRNGSALYAAAQPIVRSLQTLAEAAVVMVMSHVFVRMDSTPQLGVALMRSAEQRADAAFGALAAEYEPCLASIVASIGCLRSKHVLDANGVSLNDVYQRRFVLGVIEATGQHERLLRERLAACISDVDQCPESVRTRIFADLGGRGAVTQRAETALEGLRPWAVEWLVVQKDAFRLREVYADTQTGLHTVLEQSLWQMVKGFEQVLAENGVIAVLMPFESDLAQMRAAVADFRRAAQGSSSVAK
jgi:hypothetical protein